MTSAAVPDLYDLPEERLADTTAPLLAPASGMKAKFLKCLLKAPPGDATASSDNQDLTVAALRTSSSISAVMLGLDHGPPLAV